jgi:hypothetical protein
VGVAGDINDELQAFQLGSRCPFARDVTPKALTGFGLARDHQ